MSPFQHFACICQHTHTPQYIVRLSSHTYTDTHTYPHTHTHGGKKTANRTLFSTHITSIYTHTSMDPQAGQKVYDPATNPEPWTLNPNPWTLNPKHLEPLTLKVYCATLLPHTCATTPLSRTRHLRIRHLNLSCKTSRARARSLSQAKRSSSKELAAAYQAHT